MLRIISVLSAALIAPTIALAEGGAAAPHIFGIPPEFLIFGLTLLGVALFHHQTLQVALAGLSALLIFKLGFTNFDLLNHLHHERNILLNLFGLLLGFALLAKHFEDSKIPQLLPRFLPDDWKGGLVLLCLVFVLSSFLDNIAAAMIGGTIAGVVYRHKLHIGFMAAIVAASNAGGAGSVIGDTTTTMMWIDGVSALDVTHAFLGSGAALLFFGYFAARQQQAYQPITKDTNQSVRIDSGHFLVVVLILAGAIIANVKLDFPAIGVWVAILIGATFRKTAWHELKSATKGSLFLLSLVMCASMMPVEQLPAASWQSALGLGFLSAVFDNIPLTKLALDQGGYDWGFLAYAVGFGGSMIWFGSSAGVALSNMYPEAKSAGAWLKGGWHVAVGYVLGFFVMLFVLGWHPHPKHREDRVKTVVTNSAPSVEVAH